MSKTYRTRLLSGVFACATVVGGLPMIAHAQSSSDEAVEVDGLRQLDTITVNARKREESTQDIPVTTSVIDNEELARFRLDSVADIASRIPTVSVESGQSGAGGSIFLRGIGSSSISAAFDSAVLLDIDGVPISTARLVQNSFLDLEQVEVLKGPQSLFFGKSASAGVISFKSADPGDEFEAYVTAGYEFEEEGTSVEGVISGPLFDSFGARLAVRYVNNQVVTENTLPGVANPERGEESLDARLTLVWNPTSNFEANLKVIQSNYESDGTTLFNDVQCGDPSLGPAPFPLNAGPGVVIPFPIVGDCDGADGEIQIADPNPAFGDDFAGLASTTPFVDSELTLARLKLDFDLTDNLTLTSISSISDFDTLDTENFSFSSFDIVGSGAGRNRSENISQELRLTSDFDGRFNFMLGAFYQDRDILFDAVQVPIGFTPLGVLNPAVGVPTPDPVTGFTPDYRKVHDTDTEAISVFSSVDFDVTDRLSIGGGIRYTDEDKSSTISLPFVHAFGAASGLLLPQGTVIGPIEFADDDVSWEISSVYAVNNNINLFAAYKTGFKSGGVDNSALPFFSLGLAAAAGDFSSFVFDSETAKGFETGVKSTLLNGTLRFNATAFRFVYDDLQVQNFEAATFNFVTSNAGEITSQGVEADFVWLPNIDGLTIDGALAFTDSSFTDSFVVTDELEGRDVANSPRVAGNLGAFYSRPIANNFQWTVGSRVSYSGSYFTAQDRLTDLKQDAFATFDLTTTFGAADGRWDISLIGTNLSDKRVLIRTLEADRSVTPTSPTDLLTVGSRGRQIYVQGRVRF